MQNDKRLLSCPFCGGKPFAYTTGNVSCGYYVEIICENCGCRTDRAYEEVASEVWNTREPMERIVGEISLLERKQKKIMRETGINSEVFETVRIDEYVKLDEVLDIVKGGVDNAG